MRVLMVICTLLTSLMVGLGAVWADGSTIFLPVVIDGATATVDAPATIEALLTAGAENQATATALVATLTALAPTSTATATSTQTMTPTPSRTPTATHTPTPDVQATVNALATIVATLSTPGPGGTIPRAVGQ